MIVGMWYKEGLPFECTGCGKCCTGFPGYVWVDEEEIEKLALFLNLSVNEFSLRYLRSVEGQFSLKEEPETYACVFLEGKRCTVYENRPKQCRTYPFWPQNLTSAEAWDRAATRCEGIHPKSPVIPLKVIQKHLDS